MPSKLKRRPAPPRYRVNYDAKDASGKPLKAVPRVVISRRGVRKRILNLATQIRIAREKQALARRNSTERLEEDLALHYLRDVPSVFDIALELETGARSMPRPPLPIALGRALLTPST
jgi:hypothetical protein